MRIVLGFLSGFLGMIAGWFALAFLVISLAGPDRDGGIAMGAFFEIGPFGGLTGFGLGVWLFIKLGVVRIPAAASETAPPARTRISRPFAAFILAVAGGLAWWGWYELIRSPYLTRGYMTLELQFRLPLLANVPVDSKDVQIHVWEDNRESEIIMAPSWHGHDGERPVILAHATLSMKTSSRRVSLQLPDMPEQTWQLPLPSDPASMPGFTTWTPPSGAASVPTEMRFRLTAER